jgi:hypothetical protein
LSTLPESLIETIKALVKAHEAFKTEIEELQALSNEMQSQIDRLVARKENLASITPGSKEPVRLPRAIVPREVTPQSDAQPGDSAA